MIEPIKKEYIEHLSQMINCETVSYFDSYDEKKFSAFQKVLKKIFPNVFKTFTLELFDGSILLTWKVESSLDPILFMSHQDTVPAQKEWIHNPFKATIENGKMYGRGTLDTKENLWAIFESLEELINEGFVPKRTIYIESACNEETNGTGCKTIVDVLKSRNVHLSYVMDEGGMVVEDPLGMGEGLCAMIALGEKATLDLMFKAESTGGHASTPPQNSPLVRLGKFMTEVDQNKLFSPYLNETTMETFKSISERIKGPKKIILKNPSLYKPVLTNILDNSSPAAKALVRTTICFTKAQGSDGYNVIPNSAYVTGNIRVSHHDGVKKVIDCLTACAKKYQVEVSVISGGYESKVCKTTTNEFEDLKKCIKEVFPNALSVPYIANGASDSRYFSEICDNVFRFAPFTVTNEQLETIHGLDENIDLITLPRAVTFFKTMIKNSNQ